MARDRNTSPETDETRAVDFDPQAAELQQQQAPPTGGQDNEDTTTNPMIKNKLS
jgi:hypothetical protein